jgi:hypothetical protein
MADEKMIRSAWATLAASRGKAQAVFEPVDLTVRAHIKTARMVAERNDRPNDAAHAGAGDAMVNLEVHRLRVCKVVRIVCAQRLRMVSATRSAACGARLAAAGHVGKPGRIVKTGSFSREIAAGFALL